MAAVDNSHGDGFSFIWTIKNFSYCLQNKSVQLAKSPFFVLKEYDDIEWYLSMSRHGLDSITLVLNRNGIGFQSNDDVGFELSIYTTTGIFIKERDQKEVFSSIDNVFKFALRKEDLCKKRPDAFLDNDSLTIKCRIWKVKDTIIPSGRCHARTTITVRLLLSTSYIWKLKNFAELENEAREQKVSIVTNKDIFTMDLVYTVGNFEDNKIEICVRDPHKINKCFYSTCKISLLDVNGKTVHTVCGEFWYDETQEQVWNLPMISKSTILRNKELYLQKGALSLNCDFTFSSVVQYDKVEVIKYGIADLDQKEHFNQNKEAGSLKDNLKLLYTAGKFSDLTIRTPNKSFPVHKYILCARSEVFTIMFENEMKETQTGIVEINDIDEDTISKMLLFIYTDTVVEDLEWGTASSLYFAADKYRILALKRKCYEFLKDNFTMTNVCEVLVLADMHRDLKLKSAAQDFIYEHTREIMGSEEWKMLMENHLQLASETMHSFFVNLKF